MDHWTKSWSSLVLYVFHSEDVRHMISPHVYLEVSPTLFSETYALLFTLDLLKHFSSKCGGISFEVTLQSLLYNTKLQYAHAKGMHGGKIISCLCSHA